MTIERRLRIFQPDNNHVHKSKSTCNKNVFFKMKSLSSSKAYLSGSSSSLSATIIEESWTESTLTSINLLRITSASFEHHPFLDPSYGKGVSKLSFGGPCSPKAISKALETFPAIQSLEFGPGFFIHEDFDRDEMLNVPQTKEFPGIESLTVNVDAKKYFKLKETRKAAMNTRIMCCLNILSGFQHLSHCSLSLPNTPHFDLEFLNYILIEYGLAIKGKKWTERHNKQIRYEASSQSTPHPTTTVSSSSRKRKAPSSPELEITAIVSKEDKIRHVTLSSSNEEDDDDELNIDSSREHSNNIHQPRPPLPPSQPHVTSSSDDDEDNDEDEDDDDDQLNIDSSESQSNIHQPVRPPSPPSQPQMTGSSDKDDDDDDDDEDEDDEIREHLELLYSFLERHEDINPNTPVPPPPTLSHQLQVAANNREQVISCLSSISWRELNKGEWDSFDCTSIRIGDYKLTCSSVPGTVTTRLVFSDRGIYFQFPHFIDDERKSIDIGIEIEDITEVKVYNSADSISFIFLKTTESCSAVIRGILGMNDTEESKGHFSAASKNACQQYIQFRTTQTQPNINKMCSRIRCDFFKHLFRRSDLLHELKSTSDLLNLQKETFCTH